jgi:hypothetical protein
MPTLCTKLNCQSQEPTRKDDGDHHKNSVKNTYQRQLSGPGKVPGKHDGRIIVYATNNGTVLAEVSLL